MKQDPPSKGCTLQWGLEESDDKHTDKTIEAGGSKRGNGIENHLGDGEWFASIGMLTTSQTLKCWKSDDINITFCQGAGKEEEKHIVVPSYCGPSLGLILGLES